MTKQFALGLVLLTSLTLTGCFFDDDDGGIFNCVDGQGPIVSETFDLPAFTGVELKISADVYLTAGSEQEVVVEGQQNIIDLIELTVVNDTWEIDIDGCTRFDEKLKIFITVPEVTYLKISGSGDMVSENTLATENMILRISGSGDMDLAVDVTDYLDAKISGSGTILLEGITDTAELEVSGSGDYRTFGLESRKSDIKISGSGDAEVWATDILDIKISGSGDVYYRGNPSISVDVTGSGEIIDAN